MKYRAAATQIKEIPIVFRGNVDPAIPVVINPVIEENDISPNPTPNALGWLYFVSETINQKDDLYIELDDIYYPAIEKKDFNGTVYYGADFEGTSVDYTEYPFVILPGEGQFMLISPLIEEPINHNIKIWESDPSSGGIITSKKLFSADLTGNGQIKRFHCRFALGENGTLHIKPYVILNGNIRVDLCAFASNGDNYISGDNEEIAFDCYVPVETHAVAYVEAENVGEYESILDAAMVVQYEDFIEPESIVGYEGINLNRR